MMADTALHQNQILTYGWITIQPVITPNIQALIDKILTELENRYLALCKELETDGYNWIDEAYKDESIIDNIEANEYEFKADGTRF